MSEPPPVRRSPTEPTDRTMHPMKLALLIFLGGLSLVMLAVHFGLASGLFVGAWLVWLLMPADD